MRIQHFIALHFFEGRQQHVGFFPRFRARRLYGYRFRFLLFRCDRLVVSTRQIFTIRMRDRVNLARRVEARGIHPTPARQRFFNHNRSVTHVADLIDGFAHRQTMRHFHQRTFAVAEHQHVGFGIHQNRATNGIRPVVIVRGTAQAGLNTAENNRHIFPCFFTALGIDQRGAVRTFARNVVRRVGIVMAQSAIGGVTVDHRVHVACGHTKEQVRFTQTHKIVFVVPLRLGDNPYAKALCFQHTSANCHAKAGMIDVCIAGNQNDVAAIPAKLVHFVA